MRALGPLHSMRKVGASTGSETVALIVPPRGTAAFAMSSMLSRSLTRFLLISARGVSQLSSAFSFSIRPRATFSASARSISAPADPAAPKARRANCSLAEACLALLRMRSKAIAFISSPSSSSNTSRPLLMAPTGEMMSWQTLLHRRAARSCASSSVTSTMPPRPFATVRIAPHRDVDPDTCDPQPCQPARPGFDVAPRLI